MTGQPWTHVRVDVMGDSLLWQQAFFAGWSPYPQGIRQAVVFKQSWFDRDIDEGLTEFFRQQAVESAYDDRLTVDPEIDRAYRAARSARFEFGERG